MSSILEDAQALVDGPRAEKYGDARKLFSSIAGAFTALTGREIRLDDVLLLMILTKIARNQVMPGRDNLTDLAGYTELLARIQGMYDKPSTTDISM